MANFVVTGTVISMSAINSGLAKNGDDWKNKTVVLKETEGTYPKTIAITLRNAMCNITFKKDELVTIHCDPSSRQYQEKWYTDINGWKVDKEQSSTAPTQPAPKAQATPVQASNNDDSLPF